MDLPYAFPGPVRTDRLQLRTFGPDDLAALCAFEARPEVMRYLYWADPGREAIRERLERRIASTRIAQEGDCLMLAVLRTDTDELIGHVMLRLASEQHRQGELGYVFHPDHHGHGYATEACAPVLGIGFGPLGLHRIFGRADARNAASIALMNRLGMHQQSHLVENEFVKGEWTDEVECAVLAHEWAASLSPR